MMSSKRVYATIAICFCVSMFGTAARSAVSELLAKMPAQNAADRDAASRDVIAAGPEAISELCAMLAPTGAGDDLAARYLLSGLAWCVARDARLEGNRGMVAGAIAESMLRAGDKEVKAFLISLLGMAAHDEAVPALAHCLPDADLCRPAAQALATIKTPAAVDVLRRAATGAQGVQLAAILLALGDAQAASAAADIVPFATHAEPAVRDAALYAISRAGAPDMSDLLEKAAQSGGTALEKGRNYNYWLAYAKTRAGAGDKITSETICRKIAAQDCPVNIKCAALGTLVAVNAKKALPDLLAAVDSPDREFRGAALAYAADMKGKPVTRRFAAKLAQAAPAQKIALLEMLGRRADPSALPAVLDAINDPEMYVRIAALDAAPRVGKAKAFPAILAALRKAEAPEEIAAAKGALLRVPGDNNVGAIAAAMPDTPPAPRAALLEILAVRGAADYVPDILNQAKDADESVRIAALKSLRDLAPAERTAELVSLLVAAKSDAETAAASEAVVAAANRIDDPEKRAEAICAAIATAGDRKAALVKILPSIGGKQAFDTVVAGIQADDAAMKEASLRALADWPDQIAAPRLLEVAKTAPDETHQVIALRGYVRLAGLSPDNTVKMLAEALAVAKRAEEKTLVLGALGRVCSIEALDLAASCLGDPALQAQAAVAAVQIACPRDGNEHGLVGPHVADVLKRVEPLLTDADMQQRVKEHVARMPIPDAEGFIPLFNGKDLTGWVGDTKGYVVENGSIVCKPGGNLYTENEYKDFILRFEFKLTPNANNGLGIRAPLTGDAAYTGLEIQILDDTGDQYTNLHPYQYHGSIYGIVPAKTGHLKPVGEWNFEEVIVKGRQVTVKLNGVTIVDADLDQATADGAMDGKDHPGLKNEKGHIGFLGHGSVIEFRNIRIKPL